MQEALKMENYGVNPTRMSLYPLVSHFMHIPKHQEWHSASFAPTQKFFHPSYEQIAPCPLHFHKKSTLVLAPSQ